MQNAVKGRLKECKSQGSSLASCSLIPIIHQIHPYTPLYTQLNFIFMKIYKISTYTGYLKRY